MVILKWQGLGGGALVGGTSGSVTRGGVVCFQAPEPVAVKTSAPEIDTDPQAGGMTCLEAI